MARGAIRERSAQVRQNLGQAQIRIDPRRIGDPPCLFFRLGQMNRQPARVGVPAAMADAREDHGSSVAMSRLSSASRVAASSRETR